MYNEKIEALISAALADGVLTEKEKQVLFKRAQAEGIDLDQFEMELDARLVELQKAEEAKAKAEKEKSAPKSTKYGDVRKCPICGAMVPSLAGICPECGYEFSGVDANLSSQKLADLLLKEKNEDRKKEIIETFPIPNTKSDLFEFLTALQPRMKDASDPLSISYYKKYQECIAKAKVSFANDAHLKPFIDAFAQEKKDIRKNQIIYSISEWFSDHKGLFIAICGLVILGSIPYIIKHVRQQKEAQKVEMEQNIINESQIRIEQSVKNGNESEVMSAVKEAARMDYPIEIITLLTENNYIDAAIYFFNNKTEHYPQNFTGSGDFEKLQFTRNACNSIYNALINAERMEEAWDYKYRGRIHVAKPDNAPMYYEYVSEVANYYCKKNDKQSARKFVKRHISWFIENVDNDRYKGMYKQYQSQNVNKRLMQQIDNY